jgi:ubiquinone biosynthesis protein
MAYRILSTYDKRLRAAEAESLRSHGRTAQQVSAATPNQSIRALGGATVLVCGTLILLLGPGPWLPAGLLRRRGLPVLLRAASEDVRCAL